MLGSTGRPTLGVTNTDTTQPTTYTASAFDVNVTAGSDAARTDGSTTGFFAIDFGTFGGPQLVSFSGMQFSLYLSQDGFSQVSSGDIAYAGPRLFSVSDLTTNAGWHTITESNGTFYIGQTTSGQEVITGPLPIRIASAFKYIKVYDGSSTAVAVSVQYIKIQPGLTLTPTSGPAGTTVTAIGGGFPSNTVVDLVYSYVFYPWNGVATSLTGDWTTGINTGSGFFSSAAPMLDSKQAYNPKVGVQPVSRINITAKYQATPLHLLAAATFDENTRVFTCVKSYDSGGHALDFTNAPPGPYGNDSSAAGSNLAQPVLANVLGKINVAGNNMMANSLLGFWIGATLVGSSTTNVEGHFNTTIAVPILPAGTTVMKVINNGVTYEFNIYLPPILPTLVLTPSSGPVGTHVTVVAYGFPANTKWFLYWHEYSLGDATWYQIAHGTINASGTFNMTVAFVVPHSYGGSHLISASSANVSTSSPNSPVTTEAYVTSIVTTSTVTTTTARTTELTTIIRSTTITQFTTITQSTTQMETTTQATTITESTTQMETTTQVTTMTTTTGLSTAYSTYAYVALGAVAIVAIAALAAWALRSRRS
ncbi:MAG: hypothetical protein ABR867_03745 [Nitrososphaerales archaeon]